MRASKQKSHQHPPDSDVIDLFAEIMNQLNEAKDLEAVLEKVTSVLKELAEVDRVMVYQLD